MADVRKLINQLNSNDSQKRLEACQELAKAPYIPFEGLEALRKLTNDSNREVADAAQRTLDLHASQSATNDVSSQPAQKEEKKRLGFVGWAIISFFVFFTLYVIYILIQPVIAETSPVANETIFRILDPLVSVFGWLMFIIIIYGLYRLVRRLFR